jgi:hypothetical protein
MLWEPRELLALALLSLNPLEPPLNPLDFAALLCGMSRLPMLYPPELALRLAALEPALLVLAALDPVLLALVALPPALLDRVALPVALVAVLAPPVPDPALRLPVLKDCWVALTRLPAPVDWARVDPENLLAVALFE